MASFRLDREVRAYFRACSVRPGGLILSAHAESDFKYAEASEVPRSHIPLSQTSVPRQRFNEDGMISFGLLSRRAEVRPVSGKLLYRKEMIFFFD